MKLSPDHLRKRISKRARDKQDQSLKDQGWYNPSARSEMDAVFIGGCGRSGTTLFKELLNRHSRCACGPETSLYGLPFNVDNIAAPWDINRNHLESMVDQSSNLIEFADRFANEFLHNEGKKRWVEKTPNNVRAVDRLLTWYPNARFIHVIRDGRDVVCSLRKHPRERVVNGKIIPVESNNPVERSATRWLNDTSMGLAFQNHPRCLEVRYEDFVVDPNSEMAKVCEFIGEDFEHGMLNPDPESSVNTQRSGQNMNNAGAARPITPKSIGRWKTDLKQSERGAFIDIAGELLIALGYVSDHSWTNDVQESRGSPL
ncbi:MAG: sulfotransferase [Phycisphaerales bacterium]|nr:sulfotransferase [Phycisphaerales bacterium]